MPMIMMKNSIVQLTFEGRHDGQQTLTTMSYQYVDDATVIDAKPVLQAFGNVALGAGHVWEKYLQCLSVDVGDLLPYVQLIGPPRYAYIAATIVPENGLLTGPCLPANTAQVVTRRGDIADRRNISTLHLPGVPVAAVENSFLLPAQQALLQSFVDQSCQAIVTPTGQLFVPVAYRRSDPAFSRKVTEGFVQNTVRVVRRRTVGVGA